MPFSMRPIWSHSPPFPICLAALLALLLPCFHTAAIDLSGGLLYAVPPLDGKPPTLTGRASDWDLSVAEPFWIANQTATQMNAAVALEYDKANLYFFAKVHLPSGRKLQNENSPADPFWKGDMLELRLCSDPTIPYPLPAFADPRVADSNRICHISMWEDTVDGKTNCNIAYGGKLHAGNILNPPGIRLVFTETDGGYIAEAKIPWTALNVPDGVNPFAAGQRMAILFGAHWKFNDFFATGSAIYNANPGEFGFRNLQDWGQAEFSPKGNLPPRHGTMEEALAAASAASVSPGVPISLDVPAAGKLSVNILGARGEVIRELTGGQPVSPGPVTIHWDGYDQWGFAMPPGRYKWGAYLSGGLQARYIGTVGTSGTPAYPTPDEKGGWGGDHGLPTAVAADPSGLYFGWFEAEAQRQIVKIDYAGNTLWRKSPFVQGGFSSLHAMASNGKYVFLAYDGSHPVLSRISATTGVFALFDNPQTRGTAVPICTTANTPIPAPAGASPRDDFTNKDGSQPECLGLAATDREVFASIYSQNLIQVFDAETGQPTRTLICPSPRGLALDRDGNLYAVSYGTDQAPEIVRFDLAAGNGKPVVTAGLSAPLGVTVDVAREIAVTDEGPSQQVKIFSSNGKLLHTYGKAGGRPWIGTYDPDAFLAPSAIAADAGGDLVVAESSIPKIFDRIDPATGKNLGRWCGYPSYGLSNIPDSDNPLTSYYPFEPSGFARATVSASGDGGTPTAYWDYSKVDLPGPGQNSGMALPYVQTLQNGRKYFIQDTNPHYVCLIEGDTLLPVGRINTYNPHGGHFTSITDPYYEVWVDRNGDRKVDPEEILKFDKIEGKPVPIADTGWNSMWLDANGDAYFLTEENAIVKIPSDGFSPDGAILWNPAKASFAVPSVVPSLSGRMGNGPRQGMAGVRADSNGNIYTCVTTTLPSFTPDLEAKIEKQHPGLPQSFWWVYANPDLAKRMHEGLGHTGESNAVKFAKFDSNGAPLWIAGRKAVAAPGPGEMYHFWSMGGMVGDDYVAGASEWGTIYFYTSDGFYVDEIMSDPAALPPASPYTFGSETFSGRIAAFPKLGKVYAYQQGGIYAVDGFDGNLKVAGEKRLSGTVDLDKVYAAADASSSGSETAPMTIASLSGDSGSETVWASIPTQTLVRSGSPLATAQFGIGADTLYARIHVADDTPLQNGADDPSVVFKGGDVAGFDLGPAGDRKSAGAGDVRILAALIHGQPRLIAMKPLSGQGKQSQDYSTPSSGTRHFDFVGDVPGGKVTLTPDPDGRGYTALLAVPVGFLEFPIDAGTNLKGDVEILLSGSGSHGLQTASRNWLFSGGHVETTMTDDIPTEAGLYPQFWGPVAVK